MPLRIGIVGAGVIGLSTAVSIQDLLTVKHPYPVTVTVLADQFTPDTTGDGAAGFWMPYQVGSTPVERVRKWASETFQHVLNLARTEEASETGTFPVSGSYIFTEKFEEPFWKDDVIGYTHMTPDQLSIYPGHDYGFSFTTIMTECKSYLPWMLKRFTDRGGTAIRRKINRLDELAEEFDIIVNCTGVGARHLVPDESVIPLKGQIIQVEAPWIKRFLISDDADILVGSTHVTLGGTVEPGVWDKSIDLEARDRIWNNVCVMEPSLKRAKVKKNWAGLRPGRPEVRLEPEIIQTANGTKHVVHNYGHGGCGITMHWGCALEAAQLVKKLAHLHFSSKI